MTDVLDYILEENVGFILRQATQRHVAIFARHMTDDLTPTQFSALVKLYELGPCSQNRLGRLTSMDAPTIKGVIDRLGRRGFTTTRPEPDDARLLIVALTEAGRDAARRAIPRSKQITEETLAPLSGAQRAQFLNLLKALR
jgi:DNA-binding MarR family transcriptional regulator